MEEIPQIFKGLSLIGKYPNFAMYINPRTKIRECFTYQELLCEKNERIINPRFRKRKRK